MSWDQQDFVKSLVSAAPNTVAAYHTDLVLQKPKRIDFWFTNDYATRECDRNVTLQSVEVR